MPKKVIVFDPTSSDPQSNVRGIGRYIQILKENFAGGWTFTDKISIRQPDETIFINPFFNIIQYPLLMKRVASKQVAVIHDLIPLKYPKHFPIGIKGSLNVLLNKLILNNYDLIVTDSQSSKKDIVRILKIKSEKIKVIYPCLTSLFRNSNLLRNSKLEIRNYCIYVGDATWNKNLVKIAQAIKIAGVNCVFVGKVFNCQEKCHERRKKKSWLLEFNEFKELTKNDKHFIFKGFLTDLELIKLYEQAEVNLLLSRDEGFGFSPLEAGLFACPSLVSDIPIFREIMGQGNAIFIDQNHPRQIAEQIKKIFNDKKLHDEIGFKAQARAKEYNQERFIKEFKQLLND